MITNEWMSPVADDAAARYDRLTLALQGLFTHAIAQADLGSARSFRRVAAEALSLIQGAIESERAHFEEALPEIATAAHVAVSHALGISAAQTLPDAASEAVSASVEHVLGELVLQMTRDASTLREALRRHALQVSLVARARGISRLSAQMEARLSHTPLEFGLRDRGGARWSSRRFVRALTRQSFLNAYNETALVVLADLGHDRAEIQHLDPKSHAHGTVISLGPDADLPTYAEIRESIFHPNAEAVIVPLGAA